MTGEWHSSATCLAPPLHDARNCFFVSRPAQFVGKSCAGRVIPLLQLTPRSQQIDGHKDVAAIKEPTPQPGHAVSPYAMPRGGNVEPNGRALAGAKTRPDASGRYACSRPLIG